MCLNKLLAAEVNSMRSLSATGQHFLSETVLLMVQPQGLESDILQSKFQMSRKVNQKYLERL
jgi:hypothetical protein